jgi:DNA replication protein DnaC
MSIVFLLNLFPFSLPYPFILRKNLISQFAPQGWHGKIGEKTLADAILDRIVHDSYTIFIEGKDSMRKKKGIKTS